MDDGNTRCDMGFHNDVVMVVEHGGTTLLAEDIVRYVRDCFRYSECHRTSLRYRNNIVEHLVYKGISITNNHTGRVGRSADRKRE
ncbi:hypothetical protein AVEN_39930-1 [Araneus ventricosus]|uniref:Uncharacterized protein n=1 Tax=Araneus ventricosus TaxID=182803 RepID=A0A4Y2G0X9_ARAVE|nr:hypothetical protein AVEN_39930-1 [Araneus ventricosus]